MKGRPKWSPRGKMEQAVKLWFPTDTVAVYTDRCVVVSKRFEDFEMREREDLVRAMFPGNPVPVRVVARTPYELGCGV